MRNGPRELSRDMFSQRVLVRAQHDVHISPTDNIQCFSTKFGLTCYLVACFLILIIGLAATGLLQEHSAVQPSNCVEALETRVSSNPVFKAIVQTHFAKRTLQNGSGNQA
jgi:hypothetical protein